MKYIIETKSQDLYKKKYVCLLKHDWQADGPIKIHTRRLNKGNLHKSLSSPSSTAAEKIRFSPYYIVRNGQTSI